MKKDLLTMEDKINEFKAKMRAENPDYKLASKMEGNLIKEFSLGCLLGDRELYAEGDKFIRFVQIGKGKFTDPKDIHYFDFDYNIDNPDKPNRGSGYCVRAPCLEYVDLWNEKTKGMENPEDYY